MAKSMPAQRPGTSEQSVRTPNYRYKKHPRRKRGSACEHMLIAERALGRQLPEGAEVHHVDEDRSNNSHGNLVICQDRAYHMLLHRRRAAFLSCGHADWLKCWWCKNYDSPDQLSVYVRKRGDVVAIHDACNREKWRKQATA